MPFMKVRRFAPVLFALMLVPAIAMAQGDNPPLSPDEMGIFPYMYVDYTQAGHEYRLVNSRAVVLGEILSMRDIEGTEKTLNRSVTLRVESFLLKDKAQQDGAREVKFRCLPLGAPLQDMKVGDRCLLLLVRDLQHDNMLILPTDYHYYPVSKDGVVSKLFKERPTIEDPLLREIGLSDFLREIRRVLTRVSIEEQAHNADLLFEGTVEGGAQGKGAEKDYYIARIVPDKIYKGDPGDGIIKIHTTNDMEKYTLKTLNRPSFRKGQKVFIFANKDPTYTAEGSSSPDTTERWILISGRQSVWDVHPRTVWRAGRRPIKTDEFFQTIENVIAP
jgi:hypothetical protein